MIGFVLGTSEGKEILSYINRYTEDIVVSTATEHGAEIYKDFKAKYFNSKPLNAEEFKALIRENKIKVFVDASHPYAKEVSKTIIDVCKDMSIEYIRYERKSYFEDIKNNEKIIIINDYNDLQKVLENIDGNILNTTGSNNALNIEALKIKNRVIHRIMPSPEVISKFLEAGIRMENIIAIRGPFGIDINNGIIKEYKIKGLITKDSGYEGGVKEKLESALNNDVKVIVIRKPRIDYGKEFNSIEEMLSFIIRKYDLKEG